MGRQHFLTRFPPGRLNPLRGDPGVSDLTEGSGDPDVVTVEIMSSPDTWSRPFGDPVFREAVELAELPPSFYETLGQWRALAEDSWLGYGSPSVVADVSRRLNAAPLDDLRVLCNDADFDRLVVSVIGYAHVARFYRAAAAEGQAVLRHSA